jgi:hypothetical protein
VQGQGKDSTTLGLMYERENSYIWFKNGGWKAIKDMYIFQNVSISQFYYLNFIVLQLML